MYGLLKSKSLYGLSKSKSLYGLSKSKSLYGLSKSKSLYGLSKSKSLYGLSKSKSLYGLSKSLKRSLDFLNSCLIAAGVSVTLHGFSCGCFDTCRYYVYTSKRNIPPLRDSCKDVTLLCLLHITTGKKTCHCLKYLITCHRGRAEGWGGGRCGGWGGGSHSFSHSQS